MSESYIVYVQTNSDGYITAVNSSEFLTDTAGWTKIGEGYGDKFHHAQGNYFHQPVITEGGAYRYKLAKGAPVECTAEEIAVQEAALQPDSNGPTTDERLADLEEAFALLLSGVTE